MTSEEIREWLLRIEDLNMMHRKNHYQVSGELARLRKALDDKPLAAVEAKVLPATTKEELHWIVRSADGFYFDDTPDERLIPVTVTITERRG